MSDALTFIDACLAGSSQIDDVDDWVDAWHDAAGRPRGSSVSLADFLGMTDFEYGLWVEHPSLLGLIMRARRRNRSLSDVASAEAYVRSLRDAGDQDASALGEWLTATGRPGARYLPRSG